MSLRQRRAKSHLDAAKLSDDVQVLDQFTRTIESGNGADPSIAVQLAEEEPITESVGGAGGHGALYRRPDACLEMCKWADDRHGLSGRSKK